MTSRWLGLRPWRRHSFVLAVGGGVYLFVGIAYMLIPVTPTRASSLTLALNIAPLPAWGIVWVIFGLLALASTRWPPASETWGYTAMSSLAALWGAFYGLGVAFFEAPATGITGASVWALLGFMWWGVSGLRNPDDIPTLDAAEG